jgi:hypothetical protein
MVIIFQKKLYLDKVLNVKKRTLSSFVFKTRIAACGEQLRKDVTTRRIFNPLLPWLSYDSV